MCCLSDIMMFSHTLKAMDGVGGEAFSIDGSRELRRIAGLQRFTGAACSTLAFFFTLGVPRIILSWSAYASKRSSIYK